MVSLPRTSGSSERYALMWSGGEGSALALMRARSPGLPGDAWPMVESDRMLSTYFDQLGAATCLAQTGLAE